MIGFSLIIGYVVVEEIIDYFKTHTPSISIMRRW